MAEQEIKEFQKQLKEIEGELNDNTHVNQPPDLPREKAYENVMRHMSYDAGVPDISAMEYVTTLLERCKIWADIILERFV